MVDKSDKSSKRWYRRRSILKSTAVGVSGVALAGCSSGGDGDGGDGGDGGSNRTIGSGEWPDLSGQSVHYLTPDTEDATVEFWESLANDFTEATNADVRLEYAGFGDEGMVPRLTQLIQAQNPPELVDMGHTAASGFLGEGTWAPLDDVADWVFEQLGEPPSSAYATMDGNQYSMPFKGPRVQQFWYRRDLADTTPDTWDNLRTYVGEVNQSSDIPPIHIPTADNQYSLLSHLMFAWSNGTNLATVEDGQVVSNLGKDKEGWLEVIGFLQEMHEYSPPGTDAGYGVGINLIQAENAASHSYSGARPKNHSIYNERPFAKDVDTVVVPDNGGNTVGMGGGDLWVVEAGNVEAAKTFIEFILTRENYLDFFGSVVPVHNGSPYPELAQADDYWQVVRDNAPEAWSDEQIRRYQLEPFEMNWTSVVTETEIPNVYIGPLLADGAFTTMIRDVLVNDADPETALDEAHEQFNQIIEENRNN